MFYCLNHMRPVYIILFRYCKTCIFCIVGHVNAISLKVYVFGHYYPRIFLSSQWLIYFTYGYPSNHGYDYVLILFVIMAHCLVVNPCIWINYCISKNFIYVWRVIMTQSSAVNMRCNSSRFHIWHYDNSGRKWLIRHPISRPRGQAMGCLLWGFWGKLTAL